MGGWGDLADATGEASCSFLATVGPAAVPAENLTISQELVGALLGVLARLPETVQAPIFVGAVVSVEARWAALRRSSPSAGWFPNGSNCTAHG